MYPDRPSSTVVVDDAGDTSSFNDNFGIFLGGRIAVRLQRAVRLHARTELQLLQ